MCDDGQYSQLSALAVPVLPEPVCEPLAERILQSKGQGARRSSFRSHFLPQRFVEWPQDRQDLGLPQRVHSNPRLRFWFSRQGKESHFGMIDKPLS